MDGQMAGNNTCQSRFPFSDVGWYQGWMDVDGTSGLTVGGIHVSWLLLIHGPFIFLVPFLWKKERKIKECRAYVYSSRCTLDRVATLGRLTMDRKDMERSASGRAEWRLSFSLLLFWSTIIGR